MSVPTVADVDRIGALADPVARNLHITQAYSEFSHALAAWTGGATNWCTFATWASKQAGQTIRREDLQRTAEDAVLRAPETRRLLEAVGRARGTLGGARGVDAPLRELQALLASGAVFRRSSEAVSRGNVKVFVEIGREFARFLAVFADAVEHDAARLEAFCEGLPAGDTPEGRSLLRQAFTAYAEARFAAEEKHRAELVYYGNLLVGYHEQTRLQPEITASLEGALHDAAELRRRLLERLLPGAWLRLRYRAAGLLGRRPPLDVALDALETRLRRELRGVITTAMMTLRLPGDVVLRLGQDLSADFPAPLRQLDHPPLRALVARIDRTPDSPRGTGARDWADFGQRMHFIGDLFRCYHLSPALYQPPFSAEQVAALEAGRTPVGRL